MGDAAYPRWLALCCFVLLAALLSAGCGRRNFDAAAVNVGAIGGSTHSVSRADSDYDGIPDDLELKFGTDPHNIDSDGDGLTDQYELWGQFNVPIGGSGRTADLPDPNGNGVNAALDPADLAGKALSPKATSALGENRVRVRTPGVDDDFENDLDGDYIPTDFELAGFYYEIDPTTGEDWFVKWDGNPNRNYYKTDPTKWSTDADPWSDWEESTKRNLDQRLKHPGDNPCIPAYPDIQGVLTSYTVEDARDITSSKGHTAQKSWTNAVATTATAETNWEKEIGAELTVEVGTETGGGVKIEGSSNTGGGTSYASETTNDTSGLSADEWSTVTAGDSIESAKLTMNMNIINVGTMPASETRALFNLKLGDFLIDSFLVNLTSDAGFGELKGNAQNPTQVIIRNNGRGTEGLPQRELFLSLPEVQELQLGAPLTIEPVSFEAQTLVSENDPDTGRRVNLNVGNWSPYRSAIQTATAKLVLDMGPDPNGVQLFDGLAPRRTQEARVFAYDNTGSYVGSPPVITLRDAFIWAFGAKDTPAGPTVTIDDPISNKKITALLANYSFGFDKDTFDELKNDPNFSNIFDLPLRPSNPLSRVYVAKAPPQVDLSQNIDNSKPRVIWATLDPYHQVRTAVNRPLNVFGTDEFNDPPVMVFDHYEYTPRFGAVVRAYVDDLFKVAEVRFVPSPGSIGEQMEVKSNATDPLAGQSYEYELPVNYVWTGYETVMARNKDGVWSDPLPVFLQQGSHYDREGKLQLGWVDKQGRLDGMADAGSDHARLVDADVDFGNELIRPGDLITIPDAKLSVQVDSVLSDHIISVNVTTWKHTDGTATTGTETFNSNPSLADEYALFPSGQRYESLGFYTGEAGTVGIKASERNSTTKQGNYIFDIRTPNDIRGNPPDITIHEDWSGGTVQRSIKVNNAIGVADLGNVNWNIVNYQYMRKSAFGSSNIDISGNESENYVYVVRAADGRYGKLRLFFENNPDAPGQKRVYSVQYEIYKGI